MRTSTHVRRVALALAAALCSAPAASAATPRTAGPAYSHFIADGVRYVAFKPSRDQLVVTDDRTGAVTHMALADGCVPIYARFGTFLVSCYVNGRSSYLLLDAAGASLRRVPGEGSAFDPSAGNLSRIGRYWIEGMDSSGGHPTTFYLDWRTGTRSPFGAPLDRSDVPRDLDSTSLRPLGARGAPFGDADGQFVVRGVGRGRPPRDYPDLVLYRGRHRQAVLDRCHIYCGSVELAGGRASWARGAVGFGYDVKTKRRTSWRLSRPITTVGGSDTSMQATRRHVFFSAPTLRTDVPPFVLYRASWPRGF